MALKEQDVVFTTKDANGNTVIQMPITRVENVEGAVKTVNGAGPNADGNVSVPNMSAATADAAGSEGLVPAPAAGSQGKYLRGDGTWQTPPDTKVTVDSALSDTSTNPVQNKVISAALDGKLSTSGGTVNGTTTINKLSFYTSRVDLTDTSTELLVNYGKGAWLSLTGSDFSLRPADAGAFMLQAVGTSKSAQLKGLPDGTLTWNEKSLIGVGFPNYSSYVTVSKGNFTPSENGWLRLYLSANGDHRSFAVTHKASGVVILNYGQARYPGYGWFMCPVVAGETYTIASSESQIYFHKMR